MEPQQLIIPCRPEVAGCRKLFFVLGQSWHTRHVRGRGERWPPGLRYRDSHLFPSNPRQTVQFVDTFPAPVCLCIVRPPGVGLLQRPEALLREVQGGAGIGSRGRSAAELGVRVDAVVRPNIHLLRASPSVMLLPAENARFISHFFSPAPRLKPHEGQEMSRRVSLMFRSLRM